MSQPEKSQKNAIGGNASNINNLHIGDIANYSATSNPTPPKELSLVIPRIHPDEIIGRERDLTQLYKLLHTEKRVVLVNGLGGIGKTTLAQAYVSLYFESYHHIVWVTQNSLHLADDFVNTNGLIKNLGIDPTGLDARQLFEEIILKLKAIDKKPNLLIIDNGEQSLKEYRGMLPEQPNWHLLVTSRNSISGFYVQQLGFLNEKQSIALFKKHYPYKQLSTAGIKELVRSVDYHTLTIELLAKTASMQDYDLPTLQQAIEQDLRANIEVDHNRKKGTIERIGTYLQTVFNLSNLDEAEIWVLKQFTCLPPEFHSYALLRELLLTDENPFAGLFAETCKKLSNKGWLLHNIPANSYKMHRIIADVVQTQQPISPIDIQDLLASLIDKLFLDETKENPIDKFPWIPFGKALLAICKDDAFPEIGHLQNNMALRLKDQGDYSAARDLLEKAVISAEKDLGPDHSTTATRYSNLATVLKNLGDYTAAKTLLEKAIASDEKNFGPDHPMTVIDYSNLATVLQDLGEYHAAKALLEKAIASDEKNLGPDHPTTAIRYSNLAIVLKDLGDYPAAKILLEKVVASDERNFGPDHPSTALSYSNLAAVLRNLGEYSSARSLLEKAIHSDEKNFGAGHPRTATRYSNLAIVLHDLEDYYQAIHFCEKACIIFKKVLPEGHPHIKTVEANYEGIKSKLNQP